MSSPSVDEVGTGTRELTFAQAVNEALAEELRRDPTVVVIGEDVAEAGTAFKVLSGLVEEFGTGRVIDTPISEPGITGVGLGAAMTGLRPVVDIMFGDFLTLAMDQIVNQAAKTHYMSGGSARRAARARSTPRACTPGSRTFPVSKSSCPRHRPTQRACSRLPSVTTTPSSSSKTR
jgi:acetoin:2,6-dichlorophenolindophenol oxidoreductase subunit beta